MRVDRPGSSSDDECSRCRRVQQQHRHPKDETLQILILNEINMASVTYLQVDDAIGVLNDGRGV